MNNKRGGFGAKLALVLILMLASAIGGAYAYRVFDGRAAMHDAMKAVEDVDISDYDTAEQKEIQGYIDKATKELENAETRQQVYEILSEFISNVDKVKTSNEKALEEALKAAEEARNANSQNSDQNSTQGSGTDTGSGSASSDDDDSYKSNQLQSAEEDDDGSSLLNSLFGAMSK